MDISESELRAMVRDAIARQRREPVEAAAAPWRLHASHGRFPLTSGDEDGACVIDPTVRCNHCGYCLSLGH